VCCLVGGGAAVHRATRVIAHESFDAPPRLANLSGLCAAFALGCMGHRDWSFAGARAVHRYAAPGFFAVSLGAFAAHRVPLEFRLRRVGGPFRIVRAAVRVAVAAGTCVLARPRAFCD
jgi:putative flippase GtrA